MSAENERSGAAAPPKRPGRRIVTPDSSGSGRTKTRRGARRSTQLPPAPAGDRRAAAALADKAFPAGRPAPSAKPPEKSPERIRWDEATKGVTSVHGRPFDPERVYTEGDIILHKQFGMGVVESLAGDTEVSVLFRMGVETLELTPYED